MCLLCARQGSNLHALLRAPESESGTSPTIPSRTLDTAKCARQDLNLHARNGHPGLSRARLPFVPPRARMPPLCSSQRSYSTGNIGLDCRGAHGLAGAVLQTMVQHATRRVKAISQRRFVVAQWNWVQRTTGMSGDVPVSANTETEIFMRVFFRPMLPAGAHTHWWGGRLTK